MCERHCLSCESTTFCSSPFASIYVTYYKKQQCVHGFITPTDKSIIYKRYLSSLPAEKKKQEISARINAIYRQLVRRKKQKILVGSQV